MFSHQSKQKKKYKGFGKYNNYRQFQESEDFHFKIQDVSQWSGYRNYTICQKIR